MKKENQNEIALKEKVNSLIKEGKLKGILEKAERGFSITSNYLTLEIGEVFRGVAVELININVKDEDGEEKQIPAIKLIGGDGETLVAGQSMIVSALKDKLPLAVEIIYKGEIKNGTKKYDRFSIYPLSIS